MSEQNAHLIELTAEIVANYVGNNTTPVTELPALIKATYGALAGIGAPEAAAPAEAHPKATAAQIRKSITPDALISFEDGKPYRTLKRHLTTMGLTVDEYRAKWGLSKDYPMVAPTYSEQRSAMAKSLGLGKGGRGGGVRKPEPAPAKAKKAK